MEVTDFFKTLLNMTVPGFYLSVIIIFVLHIRRRVMGHPRLPLSTYLVHLLLWTAAVSLVLGIVVWLLVTVLHMVDNTAL